MNPITIKIGNKKYKVTNIILNMSYVILQIVVLVEAIKFEKQREQNVPHTSILMGVFLRTASVRVYGFIHGATEFIYLHTSTLNAGNYSAVCLDVGINNSLS